ncbi:MAG: LTA synthase family protein [Subdoligranulum sp.]|nr:LTA synthase family protein [Subdoligranulum sp.]
MERGTMRFRNWKKPKYLLIAFLCVEILALYLGGKAFYADPAMISIGESAPYYDLTPILPPQGWSVQRQWFTADGDLFSRIIFSVMADGEGTGGFTVNIRDEAGEAVISEYYAAEGLSEGFLILDIQKTVKYGERYCFEVVADAGGAGWAVPYLYVPGGELSWLEEASVDGAPMGGELHYMFLSLYFARLKYAAIFFHALAAIGGIVYFCLLHFAKEKKTLAVDIAVFCAAGACTAGQFFLCKNYYLSRTLLLCLPGALLTGIAILRAVPWGREKAHLRLSVHSWKSYVFLGALLLSGILILFCIKEDPLSYSSLSFNISVVVFLVFLLLGVFSTPKLDHFLLKFPWLIYGLESGLIFLHMEIANANPFTDLKFDFAVWNIITIFAVFAAFWAILGSFRWAGTAVIALFAVWGIANYLTVDFRGVPIAPSDLMSAGTALNVLGNYQLIIQMGLTAFLLLIFLEILILFRLPAKVGKGKRLLLRSASAVCAVIFFWQGYFGNLLSFDITSWMWDWKVGYYSQGYVAVSMGKIRQLFTEAPAGYSSAEVQALCEVQSQQKSVAAQEVGDTRPNIILILNESWFDWRQVTEFETDQPVMPFIDSLENCVRGFAVGPRDRSGTSLSEYELLTSNSLSMMPEITPFTQRNLEGSYSVVSYLEALDYTTAAIHTETAKNYNRRVVYPQLGFDQFQFWDDGLFENAQRLHGQISDSVAFRAVETVFEEKDPDTPALVYLLTIQNHGGYDATEKVNGVRSGLGEYTVNIERGFDEMRNAAEEYLSLICCTDAAFEELLRYFEDCGEPTVVCMVGDHGPLLGEDVATPYEGYEWSMRQRGTPFVIWANYPIESENVGYIGMVQLAPLLMKTAGLPLSPYYQTILDLSEEYPVLSAAFYQDADGNFGNYSYTEEVPQSELLRQYVYFEYNSLLTKEKRIADIFLPG